MKLRTKLAALFLPTRRLIGVDAPVVQPGGSLGGQQWIVPRAECQYRRADLSMVPPRQRAAAAELVARRHQPAPGAATHIAWRRGVAHLWIWPASPPEVATGEQRWLPETLLLAPPEQDGPRLLRMALGTEGQLWEDGQLVLSQWWPQVPELEAWQRFLRAGGREPVPVVSEPLSLPWASPWGEGRRSLLPGSAKARERLAWHAIGVLVLLALGWELTGLARWSSASRGLATRLEATRAEIAPVLGARERAEQAQAEAERLRGLQNGVSDYELAAQMVSALPEGTEFKAWSRDAAKLKVIVAGSWNDPRKYVAAFAGDPQLADAVATPVDGTMQMEFNLPVSVGGTP